MKIKRNQNKSKREKRVCYGVACIFLGLVVVMLVVVPNFAPYSCISTVNDAGAIGGALADYFSIPGNTTVTARFVPGGYNARPYILIGNTGTDANTLLLSASTTSASVITKGNNYIISVTQGSGNCSDKVIEKDSGWSRGADGSANYTKIITLQESSQH
ncbi:MAG: hypothetical protein D3903_11945 [Candidatus Electrothrix sp. GM3_4]|nr:hypothetical protein [Candidatus Electrothrix sp. GM3_4]